jgi:mannose-6-phosphate isomerase
MNIPVSLDQNTDKVSLFEQIQAWLDSQQLGVAQRDMNRPWGGFFVLDESQAEQFVQRFFPEYSLADVQITQKISPKILVVAPQKRLSWQYHFRRAELWRVVAGEVGVKTSITDEEGDTQTLGIGQLITLQQGERHRLMGLATWGVVAEIWQHTDAMNPSDEDDIVRLQDDFGR